jgi:hypothetical protein
MIQNSDYAVLHPENALEPTLQGIIDQRRWAGCALMKSNTSTNLLLQPQMDIRW